MSKEEKDFFIKIIDKKEDNSRVLSLEKYQTNIRHKEKTIKAFREKAEEMGDTEDAQMLLLYCEELEKDVERYRSLFRGVEEKNRIIYIPMNIEQTFDYIGFLINDNIERNMDAIHRLINVLENETAIGYEEKKMLDYYKNLVNYFKDRWDRKT